MKTIYTFILAVAFLLLFTQKSPAPASASGGGGGGGSATNVTVTLTGAIAGSGNAIAPIATSFTASSWLQAQGQDRLLFQLLGTSGYKSGVSATGGNVPNHQFLDSDGTIELGLWTGFSMFYGSLYITNNLTVSNRLYFADGTYMTTAAVGNTIDAITNNNVSSVQFNDNLEVLNDIVAHGNTSSEYYYGNMLHLTNSAMSSNTNAAASLRDVAAIASTMTGSGVFAYTNLSNVGGVNNLRSTNLNTISLVLTNAAHTVTFLYVTNAPNQGTNVLWYQISLDGTNTYAFPIYKLQ